MSDTDDLRAENTALRKRLDAIELALTYGLRGERERVTRALKWAQEYANVPAGKVLTRKKTIAELGELLRAHAKMLAHFDHAPKNTPAEYILGMAIGIWDAGNTATLVRSLEHHGLTWADFQ